MFYNHHVAIKYHVFCQSCVCINYCNQQWSRSFALTNKFVFCVRSWEIDDIARNEWHNENANYNCGTAVRNSNLARAIASIEARNGLVRIKI